MAMFTDCLCLTHFRFHSFFPALSNLVNDTDTDTFKMSSDTDRTVASLLDGVATWLENRG